MLSSRLPFIHRTWNEVDNIYLFAFCVHTGQAKDTNMLMVPGRRSSTSLKQHEGEKGGHNVSLDVPVNIFSKDSIKKLGKTPDAASAQQKVVSPPQNKTSATAAPAKPKPAHKPEAKAPAVLRTESETVGEKKVVKEEGKVQKKESSGPASLLKVAPNDKIKDASIPTRPIIPVKENEGMVRPSQIKNSGVLPNVGQQQQKPITVRDGPRPFKPSVPDTNRNRQEHPRQPQVQNTFTGTDDLENMDFVRRPTRPLNSSPPPAIAIIPSTPKPPETPVSTPPADIIPNPYGGKKPTSVMKIDEIKKTEGRPAEMKPKPAEAKEDKQKPKLPEAKPAEPKPAETKPVETKAKPAEPKPSEMKAKPAEPKPVESKPAEPKPANSKPVESKPEETKAKPAAEVKAVAESAPKAPEKTDKPSEPKPKPSEKAAAPKPPASPSSPPEPKKAPTPPAATFQGNSSTSQTDLLLAPAESKKKGGWL